MPTVVSSTTQIIFILESQVLSIEASETIAEATDLL